MARNASDSRVESLLADGLDVVFGPPAVDFMVAAPGPFLRQAMVEPNEPLPPPKPVDAYVRNLAQALTAGTPVVARSNGRWAKSPPGHLQKGGYALSG